MVMTRAIAARAVRVTTRRRAREDECAVPRMTRTRGARDVDAWTTRGGAGRARGREVVMRAV